MFIDLFEIPNLCYLFGVPMTNRSFTNSLAPCYVGSSLTQPKTLLSGVPADQWDIIASPQVLVWTHPPCLITGLVHYIYQNQNFYIACIPEIGVTIKLISIFLPPKLVLVHCPSKQDRVQTLEWIYAIVFKQCTINKWHHLAVLEQIKVVCHAGQVYKNVDTLQRIPLVIIK